MWKPAIVFAALSVCVTTPARSATVFVNFDTVTTGAAVDEHYNGGTDSAGVTGGNLALSFANFFATTGFGETSAPNLAYNIAAIAVITFAPGFGRVEASYGAFAAGRLDAYTAIDGTGALLGRYVLNQNNPFAFNRFVFQFGGIAQSLILDAGIAQIGIDDFLLTDAVPEPSQWAFLTTGIICVGTCVRRRRAMRRVPA